MAELRKIAKSAPISSFSQVGPEGGSAFLALADMAQQAYKFLEPAAMEQAQNLGSEAGAELARRQMGQAAFPIVPRAVSPQGAAGNISDFSADGDDEGIATSLSRTESGGNWRALNSAGYGGRLQFGTQRLADAAVAGLVPHGTTGVAFSKMSPDQQRKVEKWHFADIDKQAERRGLGGYIGTVIGGVTITRNAIRAMAHLGGIGNATKFLKSGGKFNPADSNGTSLADYARSHGGAPDAPRMTLLPEGPQDSALQALPAPEPPTLVTTKDGNIEPRMFSPLSGPILQAHRAASQTAYLSEMLVKGGTDMMSMSETYLGNPEGFQGAMGAYIDQVVSSAPDMMKAEIRNKLTGEAQRRYLGMVEDQQRETRERANNSSKALTERYSTAYAEALASENFEAAAAARSQLEDILVARESMPGIAWTREQSENIILGSQDAAAKIAEKNRTKVAKDQASSLRTVIAAAEDGRAAADESILDDPNVVAMNPELAEEAAAKVFLRDMMPAFFTQTPADMADTIAEEKSRPVEKGWQMDLVKPMEAALGLAAKGLSEDPIAYAEQRLPQKPPALDDFSPDDPDSFVASLAARREYGNGLVEQGYIQKPAFLSKSEIESLSGVLSKDTPPEIRAAVSGAIVSGFGPDAGNVFKALKVDGVTAWGGQLMAKGGSGSVAAEALRGQQMIDEKIAQMPEEKTWKEAFKTSFRGALDGLPLDGVQAEADIVKFAKGIYANRSSSPGFSADKNLVNEAIQAALGQTTAPNGDTIGGVQSLFGQQTLLPVGVNAETIQKGFEQGFGPRGSLGGTLGTVMGNLDASENMDFWADISVQERKDGTFVSGGVPRIGGEYLPMKLLRSGDVKFVPVDGTKYRMVVERPNAMIDVHDANGNVYVVDFARIK